VVTAVAAVEVLCLGVPISVYRQACSFPYLQALVDLILRLVARAMLLVFQDHTSFTQAEAAAAAAAEAAAVVPPLH